MTTLALNDQADVKIVPQGAITPLRRLVVTSFYYGLSLLVLIFFELLAFVFLDTTRFQGLVQKCIFVSLWAVTAIVGPLPGLFFWRIHLGTFRRRLVSSICAAMGLVCVPWLTFAVFSIQILFDDGSFKLVLQAIFSGLIGIPLVALAWMLLSLAAWPAILRIGPFKIQDGATCPQCGYCVRGVVSKKCPECGTTFDHTQLGVSVVEFERLIAGDAPQPVGEGAP